VKVVTEGLQGASTNPVAYLYRQYQGTNYLFAVNLRSQPVHCAISIAGYRSETPVQVLDEQRTIPASAGAFADDFKPYAVHLYAVGTVP